MRHLLGTTLIGNLLLDIFSAICVCTILMFAQPAQVLAQGDAIFYRAVNINGPALIIDGEQWEDTNSPNFGFIGDTFEKQSFPLIPTTDANRTQMIRSSTFNSTLGANVKLSEVPPGDYEVYLYVWEDTASVKFSIDLNGQRVVTDYESGPLGTWQKLGPWATSVTNNEILVQSTPGWANFSGIEVWKVSEISIQKVPVPDFCNGADITRDGMVDISDYSILAQNFFKNELTGTSTRADINHDGIVDVTDYSLLVPYFFRTCLVTTPSVTVFPSSLPLSTPSPFPIVSPTSLPLPTPLVTPSPPPTVSPASGIKLTWKPPVLINPITIQLGTGNTTNNLDPNQDYFIKLPATKKNGYTKINCGRNITVIGGSITTPPSLQYTSDRRNIQIYDCERLTKSGTTQLNRVVHIEGVLIDGSGGGQADAIAIAAPRTIVQIQNVRAVNLIGGYDTASGWEHSDVVQPWGGVKELRIDRLTGSTNYQGLQIPRDLEDIGRITIKNTNVSYYSYPPNNGGYLIWLGECSISHPVSLSELYVVPKSGRTIGNSVWPQESSSCGVRNLGNGLWGWPSHGSITGGIKQGPPPGGDFVPAGVAGINYTSPGYQ